MKSNRSSGHLISVLPAFLGANAPRGKRRGIECIPPWIVAVVMSAVLLALAGYQYLVLGSRMWHELLLSTVLRAALFLGVLYWLLRLNTAQRDLEKHEAHYRSIFEHSIEGIYQSSADGKWLTVNPALAHMMGYDGPEELKASILDLETALYVDPGRRAEFRRHLEEHDTIADFESEVVTRSGEHIWISETARAVRDAGGKVLFYEGRCMDITARRHAENALLAEHARQAQWIEQLEQRSREIGLLSEMSNLLQSCSSVPEAYGILAEHARWMFPHCYGALYMNFSERGSTELATAWGETRQHPPAMELEDCWALRRGRAHHARRRSTAARFDGEPGVFCKHVPAPLPAGSLCIPLTANGETLGLMHLGRPDEEAETDRGVAGAPIAEAREQLAHAVAASLAVAIANLRLRESLHEQSTRDAVTGLHNRRFMQQSVERLIRQADREGGSLGVLMVDVDHFKTINDTYGHDVGDNMLRAVSDLIRSEVRSEDVACRYGGDEFALVLPNAPLQVLRERAERLCERARILQVQPGDGRAGPLRISVGFAQYPTHASSTSALLQAADAALYGAKQTGRDRVRMAELKLLTGKD